MARAVTDARLLVAALRDPRTTAALDADGWTALLTMARAEQLLASLAWRLANSVVPAAVLRILDDARFSADQQQRIALWEAEMARRALHGLAIPIILLKGTAFAAHGLDAAKGRAIGDLDILVPRDAIPHVEDALLANGWAWLKPDPYDDAYYRQWMHELPPLIHTTRERMIDVHHTILPLTARIRPDAAALIADSVELPDGLRVLSREDMICHAAAHLLADGDLAGGLRNLWDIRCLVEGVDRSALSLQADRHGLQVAVARSLRLADALFGGSDPVGLDRLYVRRLLARDAWGRETRPVTRLAFYVRSHWLRMPPAMLARHLRIKWRR